MQKKYKTPADFPPSLPVFPLSDALLLPYVELPLNIFEPRYLDMINAALAGDRLIGMVQPDTHAPTLLTGDKPLNKTGCAGRITSYNETDDERLMITLTGVCRFEIVKELKTATPFRQAKIDFTPFKSDLIGGYGNEEVNRPGLLQVVRDYLDAHDLKADWDSIHKSSNEELVNSFSVIGPFGAQEKQALLEAKTLSQRAEILIAFAELVLAQNENGEAHLQ